jgi:PD-(D/E)XK nuclease superfamily
MEASTRDFEARFIALAAEWRALNAPLPAPSEGRFAELRAEAQAIRTAGRWVSGPADLLTILRRHRDELFHSRLLGWLLGPTGRHGLGDRFLGAFLDEIWPGEGLAEDPGTVEIDLEVTRSGASDATGEILESRADIVIHLESLVVVIENKLDAGEQADQCERVYWSWVHDPVDVRWIFLTPSGHPATSASSPEARSAWRTASYSQVRRALATALAAAPDAPAEGGRASALQYLATLAAQADHRRRSTR